MERYQQVNSSAARMYVPVLDEEVINKLTSKFRFSSFQPSALKKSTCTRENDIIERQLTTQTPNLTNKLIMYLIIDADL